MARRKKSSPNAKGGRLNWWVGPVILAVIFTILGVPLALGGCRDRALEISGTIEAKRTTVTSEIAGRLLAVHVVEGQRIEAGELLAEFDCDVQNAQMRQAEAGVSVAQAQLDLVLAGARTQEIARAEAQAEIIRQQLEIARAGATRQQRSQLRAGLEAVRSRIGLAETSLARAERLAEAGSAPELTADQARTELEVLRAEESRLESQLSEARHGARSEEREILTQQLAQAEQQIAMLREGARAPEIAVAEAGLEVAQANTALAAESVERCRVTAPLGGTVDIVDYTTGEVVPPGAPLLAIAWDTELRVRTFASQRIIDDLAVGDPLPVVVDGYPTDAITGRVLRIFDAAEFTDGNVQTPEDRMLLVYRIELGLEPQDSVPVRPGMSVIVDFGGVAP